MYIPLIWRNGYILWYSVTFIWLRWIPIHQITSNISFSIPFNLYIDNHDLEEASGTLTCWTFMYVPLIWPDGYILWYSVTFIWLRQIPIHQMTSNLGFSIPFHLYIHDHDLEASGTLTCGAFMYVPPIWSNGYILWYSVTFIWLRWIPIHQITSNLGFSIPFNLYIHDHDLEEASGTLTCGVFMYVPLIWPNGYILWYSVSFIWLRRIPIHQITSNLGFIIPFNLYIHDHDLEEAFCTLTCWAFMYVPLIWPNGYILWYSVTFIWLIQIPIHQMTSNLGFSIPFHLYNHNHDLEQASGTLNCGASMYVPPIWPNWYILWYSVTFIWHLYIHNHDLEEASGTLTCWAFMYVPLIWPNGYILWYSVTFIWLRRIPIHQKLLQILVLASISTLHS